MSKAEKFISDCTRNCSNELIAVESCAGKEVVSYHEWLTPDQARRAVEIVKEEIYEWIRNNIRNYAFMVTDEFEGDVDVDTAINDLKQAMKDG